MSNQAKAISQQYAPLLRYAMKLKLGNKIEAQDLVQETICHALAKQHLFCPDTNLRAWLFTILHNCNINHIRRARKIPFDPITTELAKTLGNAPRNDAGLYVRDIANALAQITPVMRQVILPYLDGYTYEEIAQALALPLGTVRSRISRGKAILREILA